MEAIRRTANQELKVSPNTNHTKSNFILEAKNSGPKEKIVGIPARFDEQIKTYYHRYNGIKRGKKLNQNGITIAGLDLVSGIGGGATATTPTFGDVANISMNPQAFPGTRIAQEAPLWTKFRFLKLKFHFESTQSTSSTGALAFTYLSDPEVPLPNENSVVYAQAALSNKESMQTQLFAPATFTVSKNSLNAKDKKEYYISPDINGEDRLTIQGKLKVINMGSPLTSATIYGFLYMEYVVELYDMILSANQLSTWTPIAMQGTSTTTGISVVDNGGYTALTIAPGSASGMSVSTLYIFYLTMEYGGLKSMNLYFFKTSSTLTTATNIYYDYVSAQAGSGEKVGGTFLGVESVLFGENLYYSSAGAFDIPQLKNIPRSPVLKNMKLKNGKPMVAIENPDISQKIKESAQKDPIQAHNLYNNYVKEKEENEISNIIERAKNINKLDTKESINEIKQLLKNLDIDEGSKLQKALISIIEQNAYKKFQDPCDQDL